MRVWLLLALTLVCGCAAPPTITSVSPVELEAGDSVQVIGENYEEGLVVSLRAEDGAMVKLSDLSVPGAALVEGTIPEDLPAGVYDVVVDKGGKIAIRDDVITVVESQSEDPCSDEYTANTEISLARKEIVVDRFYRDGERETLRLKFDEVERLEYEQILQADGDLCSAIFLKTTSGRRIVFHDDDEVELKVRAYKIGSEMGREVVVTRLDEAVAEGEGDAP